MTARFKTMRFIAAIGMLALATALPARADQIDSSSSAAAAQTTSSKQAQSGHILAPASPKAGRERRRSAASRNARAQGQQWSIKDALPANSSALDPRESDPKEKAAIGRVPWHSGTVGFETESKIKSTEYPDGQRVPGYDTSTRPPPSYLGFSLSMPTSKSMLPQLFGGGN